MIRHVVMFIILLLGTTSAWAGVMEVGASLSFRRSIIDDNNFQEALSYTSSLSYYFWKNSALEISYTHGSSLLVIKPVDDTKIITKSSFRLIGMDLIITFASLQSRVQPYVKIGGAHISKRIVREPEGMDATEIASPSGIVPSAGLGLKLKLNKTFSIKVGLDTWTSPLNKEKPTVDYAGRAGIAWIL